MLLTLVASAWSPLAGGCAAPDPGRTGGISLRYERRTEPVGVAIWTVETDGTIRYAGGRDAIIGRDTWTGTLDAPAISRLEEAVAQITVPAGSAAAADPSSSPSSFTSSTSSTGNVRTLLVLRTPSGRRRIATDGDPPQLAPLLELLREVARVRLDPVLDRLPRPTEPGSGRPRRSPAGDGGGDGANDAADLDPATTPGGSAQ